MLLKGLLIVSQQKQAKQQDVDESADTSSFNFVAARLEEGLMELAACPGLYCGRSGNSTDAGTSCGACAWGWRTDSRVCQPCDRDMNFYEAAYLSVWVILTWTYAALAINRGNLARRKPFAPDTLVLQVCVIFWSHPYIFSPIVLLFILTLLSIWLI